ncbi:hypothetical protein KUL42_39000 [Alteromonas sp. KUL42]|uniref:type II secretion system protein n=1 Tax=Alteromonas sp. KUL42 TaxID=2480797 RepID=UPI0010360E3A|nr:type II secretion system protein [Alteromonas sp. KUL42]TAP31761.1 type II secretion system protein [Alteromonas sp. KUL42]GEA09139.1 hypothetical protein KUL42_39000 [Alteromonas sp. KUL42]
MRKQMLAKNLKKQRGVTLINVLIAMVVVGILAIITTKAVMDQLSDTKAEELAREVSELSQQVMKCGALKGGNFSTCDFAELVRLGYLDSATWGTGTGSNPYGGDYSISGAATNQFTVNATGVTSEAHCARLSAMYTGRVRSVSCSSGSLAVTFGNI